MSHLSRLVITLALALPFSLGCSGDNLSTKGQLIECAVAADGSTSNCHPVDQPSHEAGTCVDIDEDGDDDPDDADDGADDSKVRSATGSDEDGDGTPDADDDDDDGDGVDDADDCDELPGHDSDDGAP